MGHSSFPGKCLSLDVQCFIIGDLHWRRPCDPPDGPHIVVSDRVQGRLSCLLRDVFKFKLDVLTALDNVHDQEHLVHF